MNTVKGVIGFLPSGKSMAIKPVRISQFDLKLGEGEWEIGIDPASKYTGIALMDRASKFVILLDVVRDNKLPKEMYFDELYYLLKRLVHGQRIPMFVNEKPFTGGYSRASDVLIALRGKIDSWVRDIPELSISEYCKVYPQTWKAQVVDKKKGKSRFNQRGTVAVDLVDKYPVLREYYESCRTGDYDSFDALGILVGYKKSAYAENGIPKINGFKEKCHISLVAYHWVEQDRVGKQYIFDLFGEAYPLFEPRFMLYNEAYSFVDNVTMASSNNNVVVTIIPEKELQQFQWKFGIDVSNKQCILLMFIFRKGFFTKGAMEFVQQIFPMNEDVRGG